MTDSPVESTDIEPYNIPTQEKIDYIYDFLKKYEPVLDQVVAEVPGILAQVGNLGNNPMLKMLGFGR